MHMRKFFLTAFVLSAMLVLASTGFALEKTSVLVSDTDRADGWNAATTCSVIYYNFCAGWLWGWTGWGNGDVLGVCFDNCCPGGTLVASWHDVRTPAPGGYGFTGTIGVYNADASCCPVGAPIQAQPWLPTASGWNGFAWSAPVPAKFVLAVTFPGPTNSPSTIITDRGAAGTTGPQPCGTCYPANRVVHTFYYGTAAAPYCPGTVLNDGICDIELVWDVMITGVDCGTVSVEESSWGAIKGLYR
jgi:hypothetical protein